MISQVQDRLPELKNVSHTSEVEYLKGLPRNLYNPQNVFCVTNSIEVEISQI